MGLTRSRHNDNGAQKPGRRPSTEFTMNQQKWASKRWNSLCENTSCHLPGSISSQLTVGIYCVVRSPPTPAGFMWHVRRDPLAAHHIRVVTTLDFLCGFQPSAACCLCWGAHDGQSRMHHPWLPQGNVATMARRHRLRNLENRLPGGSMRS